MGIKQEDSAWERMAGEGSFGVRRVAEATTLSGHAVSGTERKNATALIPLA